MARDMLTDEEVEMEIERLSNNDYVKLAKAEQREKYKRRQYLYNLRYLEKRGKELAEQGITIECLDTDYEKRATERRLIQVCRR